eukprot:84077_1
MSSTPKRPYSARSNKPETVDGETDQRKKKIKEAFALFDRDSKGIVVKEEVGTIMRYLNVFPTEQQLVTEVLPRMQDDEETHFVKFERLEAALLDIFASNKYEPDSDEVILQAFKVLDVAGKDFIPEEKMVKLLTSNDWAFREKEIENFLRVSKDPETGNIIYEDYIEELHNF